MKPSIAFLFSLICMQLFACSKNDGITGSLIDPFNAGSTKLKITVGSNTFNAILYDNATTVAFRAKLPMTISMSELNGNEKYFDLPDRLPANAANPGSIQTGDLMLYGSNTLVLFYKTISTSYSYTRLARVENPSGLAAALGSGNIAVKFEL